MYLSTCLERRFEQAHDAAEEARVVVLRQRLHRLRDGRRGGGVAMVLFIFDGVGCWTCEVWCFEEWGVGRVA